MAAKRSPCRRSAPKQSRPAVDPVKITRILERAQSTMVGAESGRVSSSTDQRRSSAGSRQVRDEPPQRIRNKPPRRISDEPSRQRRRRRIRRRRLVSGDRSHTELETTTGRLVSRNPLDAGLEAGLQTTSKSSPKQPPYGLKRKAPIALVPEIVLAPDVVAPTIVAPASVAAGVAAPAYGLKRKARVVAAPCVVPADNVAPAVVAPMGVAAHVSAPAVMAPETRYSDRICMGREPDGSPCQRLVLGPTGAEAGTHRLRRKFNGLGTRWCDFYCCMQCALRSNDMQETSSVRHGRRCLDGLLPRTPLSTCQQQILE